MGKSDTEMEHDAELWARIARTAQPLKRNRVTAKSAKPGKPPAPSPPKAKAKSTAEAEKKPAPRVAAKIGPSPSGTSLDRQTARKLETGRLPVEARLDLHGMKQRDAHVALRKFLKWAQAKGHRHVFVITGKGAAADERRSFYEGEERGVLRQAVPHWLAGSELASLVVSFSPAPRRLGGEGALYVRLRKGRRG
jgi:DNA-nicking Smr family endonuclease